jgi:hypothetical protein
VFKLCAHYSSWHPHAIGRDGVEKGGTVGRGISRFAPTDHFGCRADSVVAIEIENGSFSIQPRHRERKSKASLHMINIDSFTDKAKALTCKLKFSGSVRMCRIEYSNCPLKNQSEPDDRRPLIQVKTRIPAIIVATQILCIIVSYTSRLTLVPLAASFEILAASFDVADLPSYPDQP